MGTSAGLEATFTRRRKVFILPPLTTPTGRPSKRTGILRMTSPSGSTRMKSMCSTSRRIGCSCTSETITAWVCAGLPASSIVRVYIVFQLRAGSVAFIRSRGLIASERFSPPAP